MDKPNVIREKEYDILIIDKTISYVISTIPTCETLRGKIYNAKQTHNIIVVVLIQDKQQYWPFFWF